jgi:4-amino-4-deoxychorismate lyase
VSAAAGDESRPAVCVFVGDARIDPAEAGVALAVSRGLAYGDGLFETMRAAGDRLPWWPRHWARLAAGAGRLRIPLPERTRVEAELAALSGMYPDGVVKLILSRGSGPRGYAADPSASPLWILSAHPPPPRAHGLRLRWCDTRLGHQPRLAGLKHCNRLEQVLARAEWDDPGIDDGLMRDHDGVVIAATSANLFILRDGRWRTPRLDRCGIAGVCRGWMLETAEATEAALSVAEVEAADAIVLCNAVRGILPVARLGERRWSPHPAVAALQGRLAAVHPAFVAAIAATDQPEVSE